MKEALLTFTIFSFSGQTHFQWQCLGQISHSIKIAIFKTLRRLDTTWNFARSITRVSTHEHEHWEHCLYTQSLLKGRFLDNSCSQMFPPLAAVLPLKSIHFPMRCNMEESCCTKTIFSMLAFMCTDPYDTTSKVSCCVEPSWCFKNSDFDASNLKSASFIIIMLLHKKSSILAKLTLAGLV